jgi:hypothetical protein
MVETDKSIVHAFRNHWLPVYRADLSLEVIPGLAWPIVGF